MAMNRAKSSPGILIPRQILEKAVFQYVGNLVSSESNPVSSGKIVWFFVRPESRVVVKRLLKN